MGEVERTLSVSKDTNKALTLTALGLAGETGEVVELIKRIVCHDKDIDVSKLVLEMGDVLWYLTAMCLVLNVDMDAVVDEVERTLSVSEDTNKALTLTALGLAGETGEVVELVKKIVFHDKDIDVSKLVLEMGDVLWYLTAMCLVINVDMEQVVDANVAKLRSRHPKGWTTEYSSTTDQTAS